MNLGYTGKPYDTGTGLYNYGYRDYRPQAARFTTVDPIRDGNNWFAYVNNDPVNWVDPWGLNVHPLTTEQIELHRNAMGGPVNYGSITLIYGMPSAKEVEYAMQVAGIDKADFALGLGITDLTEVDLLIENAVTTATGMALPGGFIYVPFVDPSNITDEEKATTAHEIEHQSQYQYPAFIQSGTYNSTKEVYEQLLREGFEYQNGLNPYETPGKLEYSAQKIEDVVESHLRNNF